MSRRLWIATGYGRRPTRLAAAEGLQQSCRKQAAAVPWGLVAFHWHGPPPAIDGGGQQQKPATARGSSSRQAADSGWGEEWPTPEAAQQMVLRWGSGLLDEESSGYTGKGDRPTWG